MRIYNLIYRRLLMHKTGKFLFSFLLILTLIISGCSSAGSSTQNQSGDSAVSSAAKDSAAANSPVAGKKVAYIMQMAASDIFEMWASSASETAKALGMEFDAFFCGGSDDKWQETVEKCAAEGYNGLLLSHGGQRYAYSFLTGILEKYPDLKIVTFDTIFKNSSGNTQKIEGVTQFFQQDSQLAELLLDYICNTLYADKTASGEPVRILKVWKGPRFLAAFDRREEAYADFEQQGLIETVNTIAPMHFDDAEKSMTEITNMILSGYQSEKIDAIWCCYDLYASGVYASLTEGGYDIPMVSIDICNSDIEKMSAENSPWKACATTNWNYNGEFGIRVLALELADEYENIIDPVSGKASDWLEIPGSLVTQDMVSGDEIDINNLADVADETYSDKSYMPSSEWMDELLS